VVDFPYYYFPATGTWSRYELAAEAGQQEVERIHMDLSGPQVEQGIAYPGGAVWFPESRLLAFPPIKIKGARP